jgi:NitT/TauT family transport system substrate-binding protein
MWKPKTIMSALGRGGEARIRLASGRRALVCAVAAVPAAGLLAACGSSGSAAGGQPTTGAITVGIPPVTDLGNLFAAQSLGYFKSRGLTVKITYLNGGAALIPAMESGSVAIGESNLVSVLQAQQQHLGIKCFAGGWRSPSAAQLSLVVSPKFAASVTSASGLAGQTVAVNALNNSNQLVTDKYLQAHGVNPASVHFVGLAYPDMPAALSSGRVAAAIIDEPFTTIVTKTQGSKLLAAEPDQAIAAHALYACWVAPAAWLSAHRQLAAKFVAAIDQANSYAAAHPAYVPSILPKYTSVSASMAGHVTLPDFTTQITAAEVQPWSKAAAEFKMTNSVIAPSSIIALVPPSGGS